MVTLSLDVSRIHFRSKNHSVTHRQIQLLAAHPIHPVLFQRDLYARMRPAQIYMYTCN